MDLQALLGDMSRKQFVEEFFHRFPHSQPRTARPLCELLSWDTLAKIIGRSADVMALRDGQRSTTERPASAEAARELVSQGHTLLVRHAERHDSRLRQLAATFTTEFDAPVDVHIYVTPPGGHGFSWHYDAEDVFIVQTAGEKEYSLRKNTVHPWPLVETIPDDMGYQGEIMPLMRVLLAPGDWLYIPNGYWHKGVARDRGEPSMSLAVGVLSPSGIDLLDHLRAKLLGSLLWRCRLPVRGTAASASSEEQLEKYRELSRLLADDLCKTLLDDGFLRDFLN